MLIYGHRGASADAPENTLGAFRRALAVGADGVEFDVRTTADGVPVVLHDRDLARTTGVAGAVDDRSLADLRALPLDPDRAVPTLAETLALVAGRARSDLELKQAGIEAEVLRLLRATPSADWAISSFDWEILRAVREIDAAAPLWPLGLVADDALFAVAAELAAPTVALFAGALTPEVAARCAEAGRAVMVWTVNDPVEARRVRALGAAALCTDDPAAIGRALGEDRANGA